MSFDLLPDENAATMLRAGRRPSTAPEAGFFTGMIPGAASLTMEGFAKTARAIDLLGAVGPIVSDAITGGTGEQDQYFREHDDVFNSAVDYWTPKPGEVGTAGRVVGSLIPTLATVAMSPAIAVGSAELGAAEDLVRQGVEASKAVKVGMVQGTGLGLGIYLPIFGNSWATRALIAGAGSNVAQGVATRAASRKILEGTDAAKQFDPWDAESLVIDTLMGVGFGSLVHVGEKAKEIQAVRDRMTESDKAAILTANQARHLEDTTAPGQPLSDVDRTLHAQAMRKAIDDVLNGRPADVGRTLQRARLADDPARAADQAELMKSVSEESQAIVQEAIAREERIQAAEETPGFLRSAEQLLALRKEDRPEYAPELERAIAIAKKPGFRRSAEEKIALDTFLKGRGGEVLVRDIQELPRPEGAAPKEVAAAPPEGQQPKGGAPAESADPIVAEARQRVADHPELSMTDENGKTVKVADTLDAADREVAQTKELEGLLPTAAQCFLGML